MDIITNLNIVGKGAFKVKPTVIGDPVVLESEFNALIDKVDDIVGTTYGVGSFFNKDAPATTGKRVLLDSVLLVLLKISLLMATSMVP